MLEEYDREKDDEICAMIEGMALDYAKVINLEGTPKYDEIPLIYQYQLLMMLTTITNADRIANMSAAKAMRENIVLMNEAVGLLVETDLEETQEKLAEWADVFCNVLASIDLAHSVKVIASCKSAPFLLSPAEVDCSSRPQTGD